MGQEHAICPPALRLQRMWGVVACCISKQGLNQRGVSAVPTSIAYRDENRFRSDKGQKKQLPINSPIFIRSDRIAKKNDPDSITDKRRGNTEHPW